MVKKILKLLSLHKEKLIRLGFGLLLVAFVSWLLFVQVEPIATWVRRLENIGYDLQVRQIYKPLDENNPIVIVDIDDKSLNEIGRWPWPRNNLAKMIENLFKNGASVVAFDITFADKEENIAEKVFKQLPKMDAELNKIKEQFNYDAQMAKSLELGDSILGIVLRPDGDNQGVLPAPLMKLTPEQEQLTIPDGKSYLANIEVLEKSAKAGAFLNTIPDPDGVLRATPVLYKFGDNLYGSLGLIGVSHYLLSNKIELSTALYDETPVLEGINLDQQFIPTDTRGRLLIPFRGPGFTFPYLSAVDVINDKAPKTAIENKLVFVGSTATAMGDFRATPVGSVYPGVEVHACVASGIINNYLPFQPPWGKGVTFLIILTVGSLLAILFPFLGVFSLSLIATIALGGLIFGNTWLYSHHHLVISIVLPIVLILLIYLFNLIYGYLFESRKSKDLKEMFGQYVPPAYLDNMLKQGGEFSLEGESKELSVLFSDIRSFTSLSETMNATDLKRFLNSYFTPITEVIFNHHGTIDKYVGDMVMAFWGAPLDDPKQAYNAVRAGMAMQAKLAELNDAFEKEKKPRIKIGVGINTGVMNVGDMGSKFRRSYTVLGDTVNLGSRLEGQTKFYHVDILVGEITYARTKDDFVYRKVDKIKVKGKLTGVEIYHPVCLKTEATAEIAEELDKHHLALEAYFHQQWDKAQTGFKSLKERYPASKELYEMYLERIASMQANPPGPDWDGAFVSHEK